MDVYAPDHRSPKGTVIFAHGFKGFKDWGHWHLIAEAFSRAGYCFVKFNFSHNGTTPEQPLDFADLEAFGQNNFSKELMDLETVVTWAQSPASPCDPSGPVFLIGHSRGGPIVLIQAARDPRIKGVITWAAVSDLEFAWRDPKQVEAWKKAGVFYVLNARTGQQMPLYFQLYEDFQAHREAYSAQGAMQALNIPALIIHGEADTSVPASAALQLQAWNPRARLHLIAGADHVFGGSHPWSKPELPLASRELVDTSIVFLDDLV